MDVFVLVPIGRKQECPGGHGDQSEAARESKRFAQERPGQDRCESRRKREQHSCLQDSQLAKAANEENDRKAEGSHSHACRDQEPSRSPVSEASEHGCKQQARHTSGETLDGNDLARVS